MYGTIRSCYTVHLECIKVTSVVSWHCASPTRLSSRGRIRSSCKYEYSVLLIVQRTFMAFFVSCKRLERCPPLPCDLWMTYGEPKCHRMIWLLPWPFHPLSRQIVVPLTQSYCVSSDKLTDRRGGKGGGGGAKFYDGEEAWSSIHNSILSGLRIAVEKDH